MRPYEPPRIGSEAGPDPLEGVAPAGSARLRSARSSLYLRTRDGAIYARGIRTCVVSKLAVPSVFSPAKRSGRAPPAGGGEFTLKGLSAGGKTDRHDANGQDVLNVLHPWWRPYRYP